MKVATISNLEDRTTEDPSTGAMRSVQAADLSLPESALRELWSPMHLERLARTYWRFLTRVTLGLVRVRYSETERSVVLVGRPLRLLTFAAPEYEIEAGGGIVRWRIARGVLVARKGRCGAGHLQIDVRRLTDERPGRARLHIEVEVANFHPAIASGFGRRVYNATQARIHVLVTHGFLRSLARLNLQESRVGLLAGPANPGAAVPVVTDPNPAISAPDPAITGPSHAGPSHAGPSHAGPSHAGPSHAGPDPASPKPRGPTAASSGAASPGAPPASRDRAWP